MQAITGEGLAQGPYVAAGPLVHTWRLEWDSNQQPSALKALNTPTQPPCPCLTACDYKAYGLALYLHCLIVAALLYPELR